MTRDIRRAGPTVLTILAATLLLGGAHDQFRYERPLEAKPGFAVLELPPEVLSAAAPDLRDLRIYQADAQVDRREVAYAVESRLVAPSVRQALLDVEVSPGRETQALIDRGDTRSTIEALSFDIAGSAPFLKPVVLEASDDRANFREIARGSIFRTDGASSLRLRFPPNDRRYLRLNFDDRLSEPITPTAVLLDRAPATKSPTQAFPLHLEARATTGDATDSYAVDLGRTNLPATSVVFEVKKAVFSRQVRIFEPILFRDELSQHLVGAGRIERLADGSESLAVPVSEIRGARLEVEVERAGSPIEISGVQAVVEPKRIVFFVPKTGALRLAYGSGAATAPNYDLESVLNRAMPKELARAKLGPATDRGASAPLPSIERGPRLAPEGFRSRRAVALPKDGTVAYLDLPGHTPEMAHRVRLLAADGHQVPFVVEAKPRRAEVPLQLVTEHAATKTTVKLSGFEPKELLVALELTANAPAMFQRELLVYETERDQRGPMGRRILGSAHWQRRSGESDAHVAVEIAAPQTHELAVELDNGANAPVSLSEVRGIVARARLDFVFSPGESLTLLSDNPDAAAAKYDLTLLSERLLLSPALPATLAPIAAASGEKSHRAARTIWLWGAFVVAAGVLFAVLARVLRSEPR